MTVQQLTVNHDTRTYTGSQGDHDEVLHTACTTVDHLALRSRIGVVRDRAFHTHALADQLSKRHHTFPRQVRSLLDATRIEIGVRRTAADTYYITHRDTFVLYQAFQTCAEHVAVLVDIRILLRRNRIAT